MATAAIGHNLPTDTFEGFRIHIEDLAEQAGQFLNGEPITTEAQAEDISRLLNMVRKAANDADDARKAEKKPHDDAAKAVQEKWRPLLAQCDLAATTAKNALTPWQLKLEAEARAVAEAAAEEAKRQAEAAAQASQQARPDDLAGQTTARALQENAAAALKVAQRLAKQKVQTKGGERATSLRSVWTPVLTDSVAALRHYRERQPDELKSWLLEQAERDVRAGARSIPGFTIDEARVAV